MIYEFPAEDAPIRQGDIFVGLPRVDISLNRLPIVDENGEQLEVSWTDVAKEGKPVTAILAARPVSAIVVSQDCDARRAPDITLCEIRDFRDVEGKAEATKEPSSWMSILTQQARINQKWFYLPPDSQVGFTAKMGVDFCVALRVQREELEGFRSLRTGRLNEVAEAHFRERIAEFYRRYPYDEWYPLNSEEFAVYRKKHTDAEPYSWQHPLSATEKL
jgi:hypothetical protein